MKQSGHSLMAKGIMVLLSLLIMVFIFTYSWFLPPDAPVTANGISVSTSADADFQMAIGFSTPATNGYVISQFYDNGKIDFERVVIPETVIFTDHGGTAVFAYTNPVHGTVNLLADFKPIDVTGDGVTLARPMMEYKNQSIDYAATSLDHTIEPNKQYISFDLYVRSASDDYSISLKDGSYVVGVCEAYNTEDLKVLATEIASSSPSVSKANEGAVISESVKTYSKLKGSEVTRKSSYGYFSEDTVVGAVRMSFTQYNTTDVTDLAAFFNLLKNTALENSSLVASHLDSAKSLLWIPRPDIYLQANSTNTGWVLHTAADADWNSATVTDTDPKDFAVSGTYKYEAGIHHYYAYPTAAKVDESYAARYATKTAITDISAADNTVIIHSISAAEDLEGNVYGVCRVNLWIEGTDAEARRAVDGGAFFFGFDLSATN